MQFVAHPPRHLRSHLRLFVNAQAMPLFLVGPKVAGRPGYHYATIHNDNLVAISKKPVATRDEGRGPEALRRFGRKANEFRVRGGEVVFQVVENGSKVTKRIAA
jgi:hypothetical protein